MPRITELWAYVVADTGPDDEGVASFWVPGMDVHMPMIGADEVRVKSLRPHAQKIAEALGKPVALVRFSVREEVETIDP